jgi:hypothetical protein
VGPEGEGGLRDLEHDWLARMGVSSEEAVLLRPIDGFVVWRSRPLTTLPQAILEQVLARILDRSRVHYSVGTQKAMTSRLFAHEQRREEVNACMRSTC